MSMIDKLRALMQGKLVPYQENAVEKFEENPLLWTLVACVFITILWAFIFPLDVASYAQGQVIPAGQLKRIQHLEGGIVKTIGVSEGQRIAAGSIIAELEDVSSDSDAGDLTSRAAGLQIKILRINASLSRSGSLSIPYDLEKRYPDVARDARSSFDAYRSRYSALVETHQSKMSQRKAEIQETKERLTGLQSRSRYIADQVKISDDMLKQKLTSPYDHLQLKKEQAQIDSDLEATINTQRRVSQMLEEETASLSAFRHEEDVGLRKELQEANTDLTSIKEKLRKPNDSKDRTTVRTPVAGSVMTLYFKNKGAVVPPGGTIATLVPDGEELLVEAKLPISEIGYVRIGAPARLSITSGGNGFSTIFSTVVHVSPDATTDEKTGASYYIVRLKPDEMAFKRGNDRYPLRPGMQITTAILTGERSVISLLLEPFVGSGIKPLTER